MWCLSLSKYLIILYTPFSCDAEMKKGLRGGVKCGE